MAKDGIFWQGEWIQPGEKEALAIKRLISVLKQSSSGKTILALAANKDPNFESLIHIGDSSITESTYSRTYSLLDGSESFQLKHKIYLDKRLSLAEAVFDLSHELTHFSLKEVMNPYGHEFSQAAFIRHGIEGIGGELDAFEYECTVAKELEQNFAHFPIHQLCNKYWSRNGFNREEAKMDYYVVGSFKVPKKLLDFFPEIKKENEVVFVSSYAKMPYPLAFFQEYNDTKIAVCKNNERKLQLISSQGRELASKQLEQEAKKLQKHKKVFCQKESTNLIKQ